MRSSPPEHPIAAGQKASDRPCPGVPARAARRRVARAGPAMAGLVLAAGLLSYSLVLGADGPLAGLLPASREPAAALALRVEALAAEERIALYLVRSTLMALDDANRTGNYAVLRALAAPSFQAANSPERLAEAFAGHRRADLDLSVAALASPRWSEPPAVTADNRLRLAGGFEEGGNRLTFVLIFAPSDGAWRLDAIHVRGASPALPSVSPAGAPLRNG